MLFSRKMGSIFFNLLIINHARLICPTVGWRVKSYSVNGTYKLELFLYGFMVHFIVSPRFVHI